MIINPGLQRGDLPYVSVREFGATGDGVTNDATAIQAAFTAVDADKNSCICFPTRGQNYLVNSPVSLIQPGVKIFGFKSPGYNRGTGKKGNILVGSGATHGLDLGGGSTSTVNPADMWSVSNIGFLQNAGVTAKTKYGVAITRQNNGPDRGVIFSEISAIGMAAGIYIPPPNGGISIQVASIVVENSCLSNNKYGIYSEGKVWGLRFVGNQAEQNNNGVAAGASQGGAIHGDFQGGITINDNMLEGQPNAINILASSGAIIFESQRNYLETNTVNSSLFVYSLGTTLGPYLRSRATIGPNHRSGALFPPDYVRITGSGSWTIQMNDPFPVTFVNWSGALLKGSDIFPNTVNYYRLRQVAMGTKPPEIFIANGLNWYDTASAWTHVKYVSGTTMDTPLGPQYVQDGGTLTPIPVAITAGDLVVINIMILSKDKTATTFNGQIFTHTGVFLTSLGPSYADEISGGQWCLISMAFIAGSTLPSFQFKYGIIGGTVTAFIAGISAKNYGAYVNDGTAVASIYPVAPKFN